MPVVFDNKLVLESYCQDAVTVLRQACQVFTHEFLGGRKYRGIPGSRYKRNRMQLVVA